MRCRASLSCLVCEGTEPQLAVVREEDGSYEVTLCGHLKLNKG